MFLALLPIVFNFLHAATFEPVLSGGYLFGRGELLLPAVGLSSSALGDLILTDRRWSGWKIVAALACVVVVACASFYFASVSGRYAVSGEANTGVVVWLSVGFWLLAVVSSGSVLFISERERADERN